MLQAAPPAFGVSSVNVRMVCEAMDRMCSVLVVDGGDAHDDVDAELDELFSDDGAGLKTSNRRGGPGNSAGSLALHTDFGNTVAKA